MEAILRNGWVAERSWIALAIALAALWVVTLAGSADRGNLAYMLPILVASLIIGTIVVVQGVQGSKFSIFIFIALVVFALNLSFRMREYGAVGLDWQNGFKLACWMALLVIGLIRLPRYIFLLREPLVAMTFGFASLGLISSIWSPVPAYTAGNALGLFAYLALACLAAVELKPRDVLITMVASLATFVGLSLLFAITDFAWSPPSIEETSYRLKGLSIHANGLAQLAVLLLVVTIAAYAEDVIRLRTVAFIAALSFTALLLSGGRTAFVALAITVIAFAARRNRLAFWAFVPFGSVTIVLVVAVLLANPTLLENMLSGLSRTRSSDEILTLTGRTDLWQAAWTRFLEKPILGWGFNGTEALMANSMASDFYGDAVNPHNALLQSLLSLGLVGTIPAVATAFLLIYRFIREPKPTRDLVNLFGFVFGIGEIGIFGTPGTLTLLVYWTFAREGAEAASKPRNSLDLQSMIKRYPHEHHQN